MSQILSDKITDNPWKGLKRYIEGDAIYGRSDEIHDISLLILQNYQTVIYGKSGIGKTSLIRAGVFPAVRGHGYFPVYIRLAHNSAPYIDQIKNEVNRQLKKNGLVAEELVAAGGDETFWEYFHRFSYHNVKGKLVRPMIVFDQFEEIFTLEEDRTKVKAFFAQLGDLLNNVMPDSVVASLSEQKTAVMPSKGGLGALLGIDKAVASTHNYNQNNDFHLIFTLREDFLSYLERWTIRIPCLKNNRYCLKPLNEVQAGEIIMLPRKGLVSREVAELIVARITGEESADIEGEPQLQVDSAILSLYLSSLYNRMHDERETTFTPQLVENNIGNILDNYYDDAISGLSPDTVAWLEDTLVNPEGRRDNREEKTVIRESGLSIDQYNRLVDEVKLLRKFDYNGVQRVEFSHDVLCSVILARRKKREEARRLENVRREARRDRRRIIRIAVWAVCILLTIGGLYLAYNLRIGWLHEWTVTEYYSGFDYNRGWPVGIGQPLTEDQRNETPLYYALSKQGHATDHFSQVRLMSSLGELPKLDRLKIFNLGERDLADTRAKAFADSLNRVSTLDFVPSHDGDNVDRINALNRDGSLLFAMAFNHSAADNKSSWITFLAPDGQNMQTNGNGISKILVGWDDNGLPISVGYYDDVLVGQPNRNAYGYKIDRDSTGNPTDYITTDAYGLPDRSLGSHLPDAALLRHKYDEYGRPLRIIWQGDGNLYPALTVYEWASDGNYPVKIEKHSSDGTVLGTDRYRFDGDRLVMESHTTPNGNYLWEKTSGTDANGNRYEDLIYVNNLMGPSSDYCRERTVTTDENTTVTTFYDRDNNPITQEVPFYKEGTVSAGKLTVTNLPNRTILTEYFGIDGTPIRYATNALGNLLSISSKRETFDDNGNCTARIFYDHAGQIRKSMAYGYQNGQLAWRSAMGIDGNPVRSYDWEIENSGYYKLYISQAPSGEWLHAHPVDEFGNLSALCTPEEGIDRYMNLELHKIHDISTIQLGQKELAMLVHTAPIYVMKYTDNDRMSGHDVAYLHILSSDSPLYRCAGRLYDGDRIVAVDGIGFNGSNARQIGDKLKDCGRLGHHDITILRPDPENKDYKKHIIGIDNHGDKPLDATAVIMQMNDQEWQNFSNALKHI